MRPLGHIFSRVRTLLYKQHFDDMIRFLVRFCEKMTDCSTTVILEGHHFSPKLARKVFPPDMFKIVAIGCPNSSPDDKIKACRDNKDDWTQGCSDKALRRLVHGIIKTSQDFYAEANEMGIRFIDTSYDHAGSICDFVDDVIEFLEEP